MLNDTPLLEAIGMPGATELVIILVIVLLIFGAGKLPQIGDALGKSIRNFKKATSGKEDTVDVTPAKIAATHEGEETVEAEVKEEQEA
jgi:sec-independent protein translocase protein TatA